MTPEIEQKLKDIYERTRYKKSPRRALKLALLEEFKVCFHCGIPVKDCGRTEDGCRPPADEATVDHLVSRFYRKKGDIVLKVLSCNKCNQERTKEESRYLNDAHMMRLRLEKEGIS